ncbi:MAG: hypothetical protein K0Q79_3143 [Flavipsychrobacter sp.]|jgi:SpoVK/Ycf46/Vps4 family AAA+-type ATPase|nr:hypothetical protein [Flavipsychrobacter sp.]
MITTINLSADKLDLSILKSIKEAYKGKDIEIIISDKKTDNVDALLKRMSNLRKNKNTVTFTQENFFKTYRKKVADATN